MNNRASRSSLAAVAVLLAVSTIATAQSPADPQDLKISGGSKSIRLSWTAAPGSGNRYLIERGGPGYTLYEQVGGPISDTTFVIESPGYESCKGVNYTYRVRTIDAASHTSAPSNVVRTSMLRNPPCDLPIVGTNVLNLISSLQPVAGGCRPGADRDCTTFTLNGTKDRTVLFSTFFDGDSTIYGGSSFSWECQNCSFVVGPSGVSGARSGNRGVVFKLSSDGTEILATCRAVKCEASFGSTQYTRGEGETLTLPSWQRTSFTVYTR
jgi:hypothetical protein